MSLIKISKKLNESGRAVFSINDIIRYGSINRDSARVYVSRMIEHGYLHRIFRGKYTTTEDLFIISSQLYKNSYISFTTALFIHGIISQIPDKIQLVVPFRVGFPVDWLTPIKFPPGKVFGYQRINKETSFMVLGDLEKVVVDVCFRPRYSRLIYALQALDNCDPEKLVSYSLKMNLATIKRLGYLCDLKGIELNFGIEPSGIHKLNPRIPQQGEFDSKWNLYINEELL